MWRQCIDPTYGMGNDSSRVIDSIKRPQSLDLLHRAGCSDDELRLVTLNADIRLRTRVNTLQSAEFATSIGSSHGYGPCCLHVTSMQLCHMCRNKPKYASIYTDYATGCGKYSYVYLDNGKNHSVYRALTGRWRGLLRRVRETRVRITPICAEHLKK